MPPVWRNILVYTRGSLRFVLWLLNYAFINIPMLSGNSTYIPWTYLLDITFFIRADDLKYIFCSCSFHLINNDTRHYCSFRMYKTIPDAHDNSWVFGYYTLLSFTYQINLKLNLKKISFIVKMKPMNEWLEHYQFTDKLIFSY